MPKVYNFVENKRIDEIVSILGKMKTLKVENTTKTQIEKKNEKKYQLAKRAYENELHNIMEKISNIKDK